MTADPAVAVRMMSARPSAVLTLRDREPSHSASIRRTGSQLQHRDLRVVVPEVAREALATPP